MDANKLKQIKEELSKYKNISTYSVTFCRIDDDGNILKDYKGEVIEYSADEALNYYRKIDGLSQDLKLNDLQEI
tara:strand:- start:663 stop:884 length:222 start_codon:yes stop_codon:yes gene_type:complete